MTFGRTSGLVMLIMKDAQSGVVTTPSKEASVSSQNKESNFPKKSMRELPVKKHFTAKFIFILCA